MLKRIAFYLSSSEIENFFKTNFSGDSLIEPHYNLARGQHIAVITEKDGESTLDRVRWGTKLENRKSKNKNGSPESFNEVLLEQATERCVIPMNGFYIWKDGREKDHPFFVRMMDNTPMAVAGVLIKSDDGNTYCEMLQTEANTLVQPMTATMPLMLNREFVTKWLDEENDANDLAEKAKSLFLITDITVLRVSKKINDPAENRPELIQPIPK